MEAHQATLSNPRTTALFAGWIEEYIESNVNCSIPEWEAWICIVYVGSGSFPPSCTDEKQMKFATGLEEEHHYTGGINTGP